MQKHKQNIMIALLIVSATTCSAILEWLSSQNMQPQSQTQDCNAHKMAKALRFPTPKMLLPDQLQKAYLEPLGSIGYILMQQAFSNLPHDASTKLTTRIVMWKTTNENLVRIKNKIVYVRTVAIQQ